MDRSLHIALLNQLQLQSKILSLDKNTERFAILDKKQSDGKAATISAVADKKQSIS